LGKQNLQQHSIQRHLLLLNLWQRDACLAIQYHSTSAEQKMFGFNEKSEMIQGRLAMIGIIAAMGAYAVTGQVIPGIW
jgi:hypothetical protein